MNYLRLKIKEIALIRKAEEIGEHNLNRDQVVKLAKFFNSSAEAYITLWLCDKVIEAVDNDPLASQGIKKALKKVNNLNFKKTTESFTCEFEKLITAFNPKQSI